MRSVTRPYVDVRSAPWYQGYPPGSYPTIPSEIRSVGQRLGRISERFLAPQKALIWWGHGPRILQILVFGRHLYLDSASIAFSFGTDTCLVTLDNTYVADGDRRTLDMVLEHFRIFPLLFLSIPSMNAH